MSRWLAAEPDCLLAANQTVYICAVHSLDGCASARGALVKVDLDGRVGNLTLGVHRPLLPLFEAVVNSFDAIRERGGNHGRIQVTIERGPAQIKTDGRDEPGPVVGFTIEDNGVGFTDENLASFETTDTPWKRAHGGKGVGRLLWLKAFTRAEVESTYLKDEAWRTRRFTFALPAGVADLEDTPASSKSAKTVVRLIGLKSQFQANCPAAVQAIAQSLMEHVLAQLLDASCPDLHVSDATDSAKVNELFKSQVSGARKQSKMTVKGHPIEISTFRLRSSAGNRNRIHYLGHSREVATEALSNHIPDLGDRLQSENGAQVISCYVSGKVLDDHVNSERTAFTLPADSLPLAPDEVSMADIRTSAIAELRGTFGEELERLHKAKLDQIRSYVTTTAPRYRHLLNADRSEIDSIPGGLSEERLESELHRINYTVEQKARRAATELIKRPKGADDHPDYERRFREAVNAVSDVGRSKLADYVCHRKIVLDLLELTLQRGATGKYSLEEAIHELVFPLKADSGEVPVESQNLWVIDERLAYHEYLASDKPLASYDVLQIDGKQRPDIAVFGPAFATVDSGPPFGSVVILEFKRPMRDGIKEDDNPIAQVFDYVRRIRAGAAVDRTGRPIPVGESLPFYGYVIADLTESVSRHAENAGLVRTPDGAGYFGYNPRQATYVEVISYTKLLTDSKKRNRAFFDRLQIPSS